MAPSSKQAADGADDPAAAPLYLSERNSSGFAMLGASSEPFLGSEPLGTAASSLSCSALLQAEAVSERGASGFAGVGCTTASTAITASLAPPPVFGAREVKDDSSGVTSVYFEPTDFEGRHLSAGRC